MGLGLGLAAHQSRLFRCGAPCRVGGAARLAPSHGGSAELVHASHSAWGVADGCRAARRLYWRRCQDVVFIENATAGCNAVLRSVRLRPRDEVLVLSHGYQAVRNAVRYVTERAGARIIEAAVPFPRPQPAAIVASIGAALTPRTRLAVIDHITSPSALAPLTPHAALRRKSRD